MGEDTFSSQSGQGNVKLKSYSLCVIAPHIDLVTMETRYYAASYESGQQWQRSITTAMVEFMIFRFTRLQWITTF